MGRGPVRILANLPLFQFAAHGYIEHFELDLNTLRRYNRRRYSSSVTRYTVIWPCANDLQLLDCTLCMSAGIELIVWSRLKMWAAQRPIWPPVPPTFSI